MELNDICPMCGNLTLLSGKCTLCGYTKRKKAEYREGSEQGTIAGYIRKCHPGLMFLTTRIEGKKELWEQSLVKKLNSDSGFPDTIIFCPGTILMIENKKAGTKLTLKDGETLATEHLDNQYACHLKLWGLGHKAYFAVGITEAITLLEQVLTGVTPPMQVFKRRRNLVEEAADKFFNDYGNL